MKMWFRREIHFPYGLFLPDELFIHHQHHIEWMNGWLDGEEEAEDNDSLIQSGP